MRLVLTAESESAPKECFRKVTGSMSYYVIGWDGQFSTILALLPLFIVGFGCLLLLGFIVWRSPNRRQLIVFDPTNPTSLIAASSAGGLHFGARSVGDPDDEVVGLTEVKYDVIEKEGVAIRWGLVQS